MLPFMPVSWIQWVHPLNVTVPTAGVGFSAVIASWAPSFACAVALGMGILGTLATKPRPWAAALYALFMVVLIMVIHFYAVAASALAEIEIFDPDLVPKMEEEANHVLLDVAVGSEQHIRDLRGVAKILMTEFRKLYKDYRCSWKMDDPNSVICRSTSIEAELMQTFFSLVVHLNLSPRSVRMCSKGLHPILQVVTDDKHLENLFCRIYAFYRSLLGEVSVMMFVLMIWQTFVLFTVSYLAGRKKFRQLSRQEWVHIFALAALTLAVYVSNGRGLQTFLRMAGG